MRNRPQQVTVKEKNNSFLHFLTGLCAIVGGVFTVPYPQTLNPKS